MAADLTGGSLLSREDAIARDYTYAYGMGPDALGDMSKGPYVRPWRVHRTFTPGPNTGTVYLTRANAENTAWEAPVALFTFSGANIEEMDLAFDQNGNVVVSADRMGSTEMEVWLRWFDTRVPGYVFGKISDGRTGRLILDDPFNLGESDLLLFYLNDTNQRVEYRTQRDFYASIALVPVNKWFDLSNGAAVVQDNTINFYLEDIARAADHRLHVIASKHNPLTGRYQLVVVESAPYPVPVNDYLDYAPRISSLDLTLVIIPTEAGDDLDYAGRILSVLNRELTIRVGPDVDTGQEGRIELDSLDYQARTQSVLVTTILVVYEFDDVEEYLDYAARAQSVNNIEFQLVVQELDLDSVDYSARATSILTYPA